LSRCEHGGASFSVIGEEFDDLSRRRGVVAADVLDAWFDPAPEVLEAVRGELAWAARSSPPTGCEGLVRAVARARGVPEVAVVVGAGSSALIYLAMTTWLGAGRSGQRSVARALILEPTYGEYAHVLERVIGCCVERLTLSEEDGFAVPLRELGERLASGRYDIAVIVNPNNPTGTVVGRAEMEGVLRAAHPRTVVWVDEAYCEYGEEFDTEGHGEEKGRGLGRAGAEDRAALAGGPSALKPPVARVSVERFAAGSSNVVVCKTMSKVYALSGLRVAYLCGAAELVERVRRVTPPWAVSLPGQMAGVRALESEAHYRECWRRTHALRGELARRLREVAPWRVVEGCLNSVLCLVTEGMPRAGEIVSACRKRGVFLRDCSGLCRAFEGRAVRVAVRGAEENGRILNAIERSLGCERRDLPQRLC
jgi:histidinol-phosphate/aromatic aminotransferase/cobyric acid decarboxylase-like protein